MVVMSKFKVGDKVRIVVGAVMWYNKSQYPKEAAGYEYLRQKMNKHELAMLTGDKTIRDEKVLFPNQNDFKDFKPKNIIAEDEHCWYCDTMPELVGMAGVVDGIGYGGKSYSLTGEMNKKAWYGDNDLELVT